MLTHEHYHELCAVASIGQATSAELLELEKHAHECGACQQAYFGYLNFAAQQFASAEQNPTLSPQEAQQYLNSELFTRRFFDRAEREGIAFSNEVVADEKVGPVSPISLVSTRRALWWTPTTAIAAAVLVCVFLFSSYSYMTGLQSRTRPTLPPSNQSGLAMSVLGLNQQIAELRAKNLGLQAEIDRSDTELRQANGLLNTTVTDLNSTTQDRHKLQADRDALQAQLKDVQQELARSEAVAANAQRDAGKLRDRTGDIEASLVADQVKINELTEHLSEKSAAFDREHQLMALGHDVTDLMGARNLHIVDVVDTDPRGKTSPAFGRIFFTEGKSLLFYAYDLNETRIQKSSTQYRVWARREGGDKQVKNLGIFYSDDKTQRRWVFKCDDPKILSDIDSVFVTLEPAGGNPSHPNGQNLMYAYLRGQPNHP